MAGAGGVLRLAVRLLVGVERAMTVPTAEERCAEIRQMIADRGWTDEIEAQGWDRLLPFFDLSLN